MSKTLSIYCSRTWIDGQLLPATIKLKAGRIADIRIGQKGNAVMDHDFGNSVLMPGVIDPHVHINEPGRTHWEGFETATAAAAAGGITTLVDMPLNSSPVTLDNKALQVKLQAATDKLRVNCAFYAGAIDDDWSRLNTAIKGGCIGVKVFLTHSGIDEFPNISLQDLDSIMEKLAASSLPLLAHCELDSPLVDSPLQANPKSYKAYLASRPRAWENDAIKQLIALCRKHNCRTHIVHLSSSDSIEQIRKAKDDGLPISVETCPHYLLFSAEEIEDGNTLYKCAPPIRERANNDLLIQALQENLIDFICTDHSPAPPEVKGLETGNFATAWGGIAGLQFLLPATWTAVKETVRLEAFIPLLTEKPAAFLGLGSSKGRIELGYDADLVIWNPEEEFEVQKADIWHKHRPSPYVGMQLAGPTVATFVNGACCFDSDGHSAEKYGKLLLKKSNDKGSTLGRDSFNKN